MNAKNLLVLLVALVVAACAFVTVEASYQECHKLEMKSLEEEKFVRPCDECCAKYGLLMLDANSLHAKQCRCLIRHEPPPTRR